MISCLTRTWSAACLTVEGQCDVFDAWCRLPADVMRNFRSNLKWGDSSLFDDDNGCMCGWVCSQREHPSWAFATHGWWFSLHFLQLKEAGAWNMDNASSMSKTATEKPQKVKNSWNLFNSGQFGRGLCSHRLSHFVISEDGGISVWFGYPSWFYRWFSGVEECFEHAVFSCSLIATLQRCSFCQQGMSGLIIWRHVWRHEQMRVELGCHCEPFCSRVRLIKLTWPEKEAQTLKFNNWRLHSKRLQFAFN